MAFGLELETEYLSFAVHSNITGDEITEIDINDDTSGAKYIIEMSSVQKIYKQMDVSATYLTNAPSLIKSLCMSLIPYGYTDISRLIRAVSYCICEYPKSRYFYDSIILNQDIVAFVELIKAFKLIFDTNFIVQIDTSHFNGRDIILFNDGEIRFCNDKLIIFALFYNPLIHGYCIRRNALRKTHYNISILCNTTSSLYIELTDSFNSLYTSTMYMSERIMARHQKRYLEYQRHDKDWQQMVTKFENDFGIRIKKTSRHLIRQSETLVLSTIDSTSCVDHVRHPMSEYDAASNIVCEYNTSGIARVESDSDSDIAEVASFYGTRYPK